MPDAPLSNAALDILVLHDRDATAAGRIFKRPLAGPAYGGTTVPPLGPGDQAELTRDP
jgi:hypothetical protein